MSKYVMVYMTATDKAEAERIGKALVQERLAACVNILGRIASFYWWEERVQQGGEVAFIAKTRASLLKSLIARVRAMHSYRVPCIVSVPIESGNPAFLRWLADETKGHGKKPKIKARR